MENPGSNELVALGDCQFFAINDSAAAILNRSNGAFQVIGNDVARALQNCLLFASIDQHSTDICQHLPALKGQEAAVAETLRQLAASGLLVSEKTVADRLNTDPVAHMPLARTAIFIITSDRTAALQRLLESLVEIAGITRHEHFFVIDDSRDDENVMRNREAIETFNIRSAHSALHVTPEIQQTIINTLADQLPEHKHGIRFLFDRELNPSLKSYGLARNFCLLLSLGRRALVMDDDILGYRLQAPAVQDGLAIAGGVPSELRFFPSVNQILERIEALEGSALDAMADVLGLPLAKLPGTLETPAWGPDSLAGTPAIITEALSGNSPVLLTQCGTLGDPGTEGLSWLHLLEADSINSLRESARARGDATLERCCWRGVSKTTIAKMGSMSQLTGIDNSHFIPPYFPYFRGEDLLFGSMLDYLHPHAAIVELDWCIAHLPTDHREPMYLAQDAITGAGSLGLMARRITEDLDQRAGANPQARLASIEVLCRTEASKDSAVLGADYRASQVNRCIGQLKAAFRQQQQAAGSAKDAWVEFLERSAAEARAGLQRAWSPADIADDPAIDDEGVLIQYRQMQEDFADGLAAWAEIRQLGPLILKTTLSAASR